MLWHSVAAGLASLLIGFAAGWQVHGWKVGADRAEQLVDDIRLGRIAQERSKENADDLRKKMDRLRAGHAAADAELARMRVAVDEFAAAAGGGLDPDGEQLAACGRLLERSAGAAERGRRLSAELAAQATALQTQLGLMCVRPAGE